MRFKAEASLLKDKVSSAGVEGHSSLLIGDSYMNPAFFLDLEGLYGDKDILLLGINGSCARDWREILPFVVSKSPYAFVIHMGTNDVYEEDREEDKVIKDIRYVLDRISREHPSSLVYVLGLPHRDDDPRKKQAVGDINRALEDMCEGHPQRAYADYFKDVDVLGLVDGIHMDKEGYSSLHRALHQAGFHPKGKQLAS